MPIPRKLLEILACPVTKQPLARLDNARLEKVNALIAQGELRNINGKKITTPLREVLITRNGNTLYRVDGDTPVMLEEEGIACEQIADWQYP